MPSGGEQSAPDGEQRLETRMTSDERIDLIRDGLERWREGFLAYLLIPGTDHSDRRMVEHFTDSYAGWYPDRRTFMDGQVESLGWKDALDEFKRERSIPEGALDLDWDVIWEHCGEIYTLEERLGGVHVFMR